MMIPFTDKETAILLGATLMHWGVPFHSVAKRELTDDQQAIVDAVSTKLITLRQELHAHSPKKVPGVPLAEHEIALLSDVIEDCLAECGDDATEFSLHLKTSARQEVETLVSRLRRFIQPAVQKSAEPVFGA